MVGMIEVDTGDVIAGVADEVKSAPSRGGGGRRRAWVRLDYSSREEPGSRLQPE